MKNEETGGGEEMNSIKDRIILALLWYLACITIAACFIMILRIAPYGGDAYVLAHNLNPTFVINSYGIAAQCIAIALSVLFCAGSIFILTFDFDGFKETLLNKIQGSLKC